MKPILWHNPVAIVTYLNCSYIKKNIKQAMGCENRSVRKAKKDEFRHDAYTALFLKFVKWH